MKNRGLIKTIGLTITMSMMLSSTVFGVETNLEVRKLTLEEAKTLALKSSYTVGLQELQQQKLDKQEEDALKSINSLTGNLIVPIATIEEKTNPVIDKLILIRSSQKEMIESQNLQNEMTMYNVEAQYISLLSLDKQIKSIENKLQEAQELLRIERIKYQLGMSSDMTLESIFNGERQAQASLDQAKVQRETAYTTFKKLIGISMDQKIELENVKIENFLLPNYETGLQQALENGATIVNTINKIERQENYIADMQDRYDPGKASLDNPKMDLKQLKLELDEVKTKTEQNYKSAYNNLVVAKEKLNVAAKDVAVAEKSYNFEKVKYEVGMTSKLEFETKQREFETKQIAQQQAEYEFMKALISYDLAKKGIM